MICRSDEDTYDDLCRLVNTMQHDRAAEQEVRLLLAQFCLEYGSTDTVHKLALFAVGLWPPPREIE